MLHITPAGPAGRPVDEGGIDVAVRLVAGLQSRSSLTLTYDDA